MCRGETASARVQWPSQLYLGCDKREHGARPLRVEGHAARSASADRGGCAQRDGCDIQPVPEAELPEVQTLCRREVAGNDPELTDAALDDFDTLMLGLGVPATRNLNGTTVHRGAALFEQLQCAVCHVPILRTADYFPRLPQLSRQTIRAYTDLLLHDMGEGLADHRPDFAAGERDWRTAPLWGLGLSKTVNGGTALLHDGRAGNVIEAILWHGGEAQTSRDAFAALSRSEREALVGSSKRSDRPGVVAPKLGQQVARSRVPRLYPTPMQIPVDFLLSVTRSPLPSGLSSSAGPSGFFLGVGG